MSNILDMDDKSVLENLFNLNGVSGYESEVIKYLFDVLKNADIDDLFIDNAGNLIVHKKGSAGIKKVMINAHIDEVGFQVVKKKSKRQYQIKTLGNIKTWSVIHQKVKSNTTNAVLYPCNEENIKAHDYENIILLCDYEKTVNVGDVFSFDSSLVETDEFYRGKAIDNRISCFCLYEVIKKQIETKADVYFVFTVQEEITMRGGRVAKTSIQPDLCINVDVSPECERNSLTLNSGVGIKMSDSIGVSDVNTVNWAKELCEKKKIAYQIEVSDCGTSELIITNEVDYGAKEIGISIPCKYIHTANTVAYKSDIKNCIELLNAILEEI